MSMTFSTQRLLDRVHKSPIIKALTKDSLNHNVQIKHIYQLTDNEY